MKKVIKALVSGILSVVILVTLVTISGYGATNDPTISFVTNHHCTSTSCAGLQTIDVYGTNFTTDARVKLNDGTQDIFGSYWGDDETLIITDFTGLVSCQTYDVTVYFPSPDTRTASTSYVYNPDNNCVIPSPTPEPSSTPFPTLSPATPPVCDKVSPKSPMLTGLTTGTTSVYLAWGGVSDTTHYMIRYGIHSGQYIYGAPDIGNVLSANVQSLAPSTTYYFQVAGVDDCAGGDWSNELIIKTSGVSYGQGSTLGTRASVSPTPAPTPTNKANINTPTNTQEVKAEESDCTAQLYAWWLPLVLQLGASLLYASYAAGKEKKFVYLLPIIILGGLSQLANILLGCNCATGVWCERYYLFNIGIIIISVLISRVDLQDE